MKFGDLFSNVLKIKCTKLIQIRSHLTFLLYNVKGFTFLPDTEYISSGYYLIVVKIDKKTSKNTKHYIWNRHTLMKMQHCSISSQFVNCKPNQVVTIQNFT